ncbi:Na+/H+ antiporter subunit E [Coraliomargarita algicola]|uniref:Na+/H+ antiporter subunit E n=1 Tax=Coraliomargarita algicola TaxID=3092156 RepID=A0ABZ0RJ35_9BACT|nr:Na+/H+ antiporter subunit E [Coraliomargarita sp. J2-16]WPJ95274.1 Na+/H+ antiporter subunit E [Coraliomargarita sp. J2-16]
MRRILHFIGFIVFYIGEVVKSNLRVAYDVLTPTHHMKPGIIAVDVAGMSDRQLLFMANFITMTPGTLGICFSENKDKLYLHAMYLEEDLAALSKELSDTYGKRVRNVF